jgi:uncharacterized protein
VAIIEGEVAREILKTVRRNSNVDDLLDRLPSLELPDCWLVAGCIFQTIWNVQSGRPPQENIRDYDVFYFDASDLSYEAEDRQIKHLERAFADLGAAVELKNEARVHVWYEQRFRHAYPPLTSSMDGIDRFLIACTCIGIRCAAGEPLEIYAAYGTDELFKGILRPNPLNLNERLFEAKAQSYKARWPWLEIRP